MTKLARPLKNLKGFVWWFIKTVFHREICPFVGITWGVGAGLGASELLPPLKAPVMALPTTCPTAEPTATPAAVVAIWAMRPGCLGWAVAGAIATGGGGAGA